VKPPAREPSAAREAEMSVVVGGEASTEGEVPLAPAASEAAQPSDTDTVTSASLLLQSVPSTLPSPSPSAEVSGMSVHLSHSSFCVGFTSRLLTVLLHFVSVIILLHIGGFKYFRVMFKVIYYVFSMILNTAH